MTAQIIDGRAIAAELKNKLKTQVDSMTKKPGLAVIIVGDDPASQVYVSNKIKGCHDVGVESYEHRLPAEATEKEIRHVIKNLNVNEDIHGILLQLPLPKHLSAVQENLVQMIAPEKDVDGLTTFNAGKLFLGIKDGYIPCTPMGTIQLIKSVQKDLTGLNAVVIGHSNLFGKPMAQLLLQENATVTTAHAATRNLPTLCQMADILVVAVGQPRMVKADWIKPDTIVIDVGINRLDDGKICGDVDFDAVKDVAKAITPVPGGVGPMTIACLMENTVKAAQ